MTYCVAMNLQDGLVFASDSRTSAGTDYVTTYSKMHLFTPASDRVFVLMSAGNLATTQEVINHIKRDLDNNPENGLLSARYLFEVADYIGRVSQEVQLNHQNALQNAGISGDTSWILGGQIMGQPHSLMMIYPQGNYIEASLSTPYLQIGETKYGKPVLDRVLKYNTSLNDAAKLALVSLTSTANSNISVGAPFEVSSYHKDSFQIFDRCKFNPHDKFLRTLEKSWKEGLKQVFNSLPGFDWKSPTQPPVQQQVQMPVQTQQQFIEPEQNQPLNSSVNMNQAS